MSNDQPVFEYKLAGMRFAVYNNRIDVSEKSGFLFSKPKTETILLRSVTDVAIVGTTRKLRITTADGHAREFALSTKAEEARQAIVSLL